MDEKSLFRFFKARLTKTGQRRWGCLDETQIAAYADRQLAGREKERAEAHLADCDFCLDQVAFLVRTQNAEMSDTVSDALLVRARKLAGTKGKSKGNTIWAWGKIAAATAVVCLVLITAISLRHPRNVPPVMPGHNPTVQPETVPAQTPHATPAGQTPTVRGSGKSPVTITVISPAPGSTLPANKVELRWQRVEGALDYVVTVLTPDGDEVWRQRLIEPSVRITSDANLQPGHHYFAIVRAYLMEGKTVQSDPVVFTVGNH